VKRKNYKLKNIIIEMDTSVLEGIGLSNNEVKVFLQMLKLGETKAGAVISHTGLQSSAVYNAINSLIDKGLVSYIKKGDVKFYKAASPETITDYIDGKKEEYLKILPQLKAFMPGVVEGVEFYKSIRGIKTLISELLKDSKKGDQYRFFSIEDEELYKLATDSVYEFQKPIYKQKSVKTKGLFAESTREFAKGAAINQKKYLNFPMPPNTEMINNKVAIITWKGEEPSGILIRSKEIYETYVNFFEHLWNKAKS
jgi:HTH-type transcriptional regulator, sugar sensing transcriptional regulator